jgi:hypothetical protein
VLIILLLLAGLFLRGYFSQATEAMILAKTKIVSAKYIENVIVDEVNDEEYKFFYQSVSNEGVVSASFDVYKANMVLGKVMNRLSKISSQFNENCRFDIDIPINYLFMSSSYLMSSVKMKVDCSSLLFYDAKLVSNVEEYGINSSLVSLFLAVSINYQIMIPFIYKDVSNYIEIPLALEIINGDVPDVLFSY